MANASILAAFERMWQHVVVALEETREYTDTKTDNLMSYTVEDISTTTAPINADTLNGYTAEQIKGDLQTQIDNLNSQMGDVSSALDAILGGFKKEE